jgi:type IV pilus assembly protein PilY1
VCSSDLILNLDTGAVIAKMATNSSTANGLSVPYLYDANGDKVIDYIYAGDLRGNLWQFRTSGANWQSTAGSLLFSATNAANQVQPITVPPSVYGSHPNGGFMVYFGTGSYITAADLANSDGQTFYGIWVQNPASPTTVTRSTLLQQTITGTPVAGGSTWRTISSNTPNWTTHRGWYLNLPLPGTGPSERVLGPSMVIDRVNNELDRVVFLTALPDNDPCKGGGTGWLMELSLLSGGQPSLAIADTNNDGSFGSGDIATGGMQLGSNLGIGTSFGILAYSGNDGSVGTHTAIDYFDLAVSKDATPQQSGSADPTIIKRRGDDTTIVGGNPGRVNWQQIL